MLAMVYQRTTPLIRLLVMHKMVVSLHAAHERGNMRRAISIARI